MSEGTLLSIRQARMRYGSKVIFTKLSLEIRSGELVCLLGPSGCGKTTLLQLAGSFLSPESGELRFRGNPVFRPDPDRLMVFQDSNQLFPWLSALDNVIFGMRETVRYRTPHQLRRSALSRQALIADARQALAEVGLAESAGLYPCQLSGGMKQRVALARAFAVKPGLLLLDEPFSAVDAPQRAELQRLLLGLLDRHGGTALFVTHDIEEALVLATRLLVMDRTGALSLDEQLPDRLADRAGREVRSAELRDGLLSGLLARQGSQETSQEASYRRA